MSEEYYDASETADNCQDYKEATRVGVFVDLPHLLPFKIIITVMCPYQVLCNLHIPCYELVYWVKVKAIECKVKYSFFMIDMQIKDEEKGFL